MGMSSSVIFQLALLESLSCHLGRYAQKGNLPGRHHLAIFAVAEAVVKLDVGGRLPRVGGEHEAEVRVEELQKGPLCIVEGIFLWLYSIGILRKAYGS